MSWEERLREAAYTAPDGTRQTFTYEDVSRSTAKKTSTFTFPDKDGAYVQDTGRGGRRHPLRCIFHGPDCDKDASDFEALTLQRGPGVLEHPMYGVVDVVPTGNIRRRDDLATAANQAIVEVEFFETLDLRFPASQTQPGADVTAAVDDYNAASAEQFEQVAEVSKAADRADLKGTYDQLLSSAESGLQAVADAQDAVREQFTDIKDSIDRGINTLVSDPLSLAFQTAQLIQAPGRALQSIQDRLDAYQNLADSIISGRGADTSDQQTSGVSTRNQLAAKDSFASGAVSGSVVSCVNHEFETRSEVFDAAERVLEQFDAVQDWREQAHADTDTTDTGEAYQALQRAVATVAGYLVEISFTLSAERRIVTTRPRTMIDLCAELYGEIDNQLDFFIRSNALTGDEHLEIPAGREIVYYPERT